MLSHQRVALSDWTAKGCTSGTRADLLEGCAQSGYVLKLNMAMPHVFIARETAKMPRMFMTAPVFT